MRKFSYQKKVAVIRTLKEPKIKKKKLNLDRLLYLAILATLLFLAIRYVYTKVALVDANGQVHMEKVDVNFTNDIRLQEIRISEGDTIHSGQTLFSYREDQFTHAGVYLRQEDNRVKLEDKIQKLDMSIQLQGLKVNALVSQITFLQDQEEQMTRWVLLDVQTIDKLQAIQKQLVQTQSDLSTALGELQILKGQKELFDGPLASFEETHGSGANYFESKYQSPINGIVGQINKNEQESCYRMENVMTIHNTDEVFIKGYFQLRDLDHVREGKVVTIEFPDKSSHYGVVKKVYVATYEAPKEFQKKYEPTERNILTEIEPLDASLSAVWGRYHKLNVKISLSKT